MATPNPIISVVQSPASDGLRTLITKPYGVGIDCHSRFIVVTILIRVGDETERKLAEFGSDWQSLLRAKKWIEDHVGPDFEYTVRAGQVGGQTRLFATLRF